MARKKSSLVGETKCYMGKSCPACLSYPTCRGETTRPPSCLASPRRVGDLHVNGSLNFLKKQVKKISSSRVTRGKGCLGYPRPYKRGLRFTRAKLALYLNYDRETRRQGNNFKKFQSMILHTHTLMYSFRKLEEYLSTKLNHYFLVL